ncbi:sodium/potassium/calcium exchanger 1 [Hemiscyllium ocellatum]|uniref:sodium/potassium/calcium exchanger 1 n=1 Tax=Hemiscyllium ocellatum TaxID=170820 RepID=UPI0029667280|nr:sodium/potassium/calcium exchanger 1 [Hemiscyllium ocellatum]
MSLSGRRRRLCSHRVLFLLSGLIICSVHQLLTGNLGVSAPRTAPGGRAPSPAPGGGAPSPAPGGAPSPAPGGRAPSPGGGRATRSRRLLQTPGGGSTTPNPAPDTPIPGDLNPRTPAPWAPSPWAPAPRAPTPGAPSPRTPTPGAPSPWAPSPRAPSPWAPAPRAPTPGAPSPRAPSPWAPSPWAPSPRAPTPGAPSPRAPTPGAPSPRAPSPWAPSPWAPSPRAPTPGAPSPRAPTPGAPSPRAPTPGAPSPRAPSPRAPIPWGYSPWSSLPGSRPPGPGLSASSGRPGDTDRAAASGSPRLKGCIRVGDEIIPAPTATPPGPGSSPEAGEKEPPLGHTKGEYPVDVFSVEQRRQGWVLLHATGMVYMFIALALVCDEFFVPSLGEIIEKLEISDDVAGATFMAAGGSAPELFTSLIGVFISHSNVGIGTIVGSAVFNILFVIGMCAIFSREILHLTWWPLFRDVSFYILDLIMLIIFFLDNLIEWWESFLLLSAYISYVCFMKFNGKMERWFKGNVIQNSNLVKVMSMIQPSMVSGGSPQELVKEEEKEENNRLKPKAILTRGSSTPSLHNSMLRNTIFQLMINTLDPLTEVKFKQKAEIMNSMAKGKGKKKEEEAREETNLPNVVNVEVTPPTDPPSPSSPTESAEDEENPIKDQETNDQGEDAGNDGGDENDSSDGDSEDSGDDDDDDSGDDGDDTDEDSDEEDNEKEEKEATNDEEPLSLEWPDTRRKQITYLCLLPIVFPLWLTVPDVRNAASKKYFIGTFFGSILWIGAFSYLMVWWAHQVGETIGISEEIMGLTILAAGTSIPDLITSVIVARKGLGDMAVSSSVGSNIFDITVGLPVPWLLYAAFHRFNAVPVSSNGLFCAIVLLFLMLLFVIISIGVSKWKMNKFLGFTMFCLYFTFLIISVMLEDRIIVCPVSI